MKTTDNQTTQNAFWKAIMRKGEAANQTPTSADTQPTDNEPKEPVKRPSKTSLETVDNKVKGGFTVVVDSVQIYIDRKPKSIKVGEGSVTIDY